MIQQKKLTRPTISRYPTVHNRVATRLSVYYEVFGMKSYKHIFGHPACCIRCKLVVEGVSQLGLLVVYIASESLQLPASAAPWP